jgi:hypothetical protein
MKLPNIAAIVGLASYLVSGFAVGQVEGDASKHQCSASTVKLVGSHFKVPDLSFPNEGMSPSVANGGLVVAAACKAWPGRGSRTIAAIAYDAGIENEKRLLVALLDPSTGTVLAAYSGSIDEDATMNVGPASVRIDTARYDLAPDVRAFGIDLESGYSPGCVEGGLGPRRTLFIQEGKVLRPVLDSFYLSTWRFVKNVASCAEGADAATTETIFYAIGIGKTVSKGFADLQVTATNSYSNGAKSKRKPLSYALRYDGKVYPTATSFNGAANKIDEWNR